MRRQIITMVLLLSGLLAAAPVVHAQSLDNPYNILKPEPGAAPHHRPQPRPEPWLPPKYQSPRDARLYRSPPAVVPPAPGADVPPAIVVPETGRVLPNIPTLSPSGPNGIETGQDRAVRCANQLGTYGAQAGNPSAYLGSCVTQ
ncbi:hypothetical protein ASD45_06710 [Pseudolabrys sp. Root1462]|jgi:hypothetical protein|uniref:hypothetical protein n=1 Tax=Pseudolabrys sp. Root1462 TaxID=1736466 RepID=UPI000703034F|nr:hypothetical protein [Pseudolabrys sp. Root1462]KQZ00577.1 hypothetical protein ASD45_06710 [Pseudolabrys sp. Root1462]